MAMRWLTQRSAIPERFDSSEPDVVSTPERTDGGWMSLFGGAQEHRTATPTVNQASSPAATSRQSPYVAAAAAHRLGEPFVLTPEMVGISPGRWVTGDELSLIVATLSVLARDVLGQVESAREWLTKEPIPALGNETAANLIAKGLGSAVVSYINEMRFGSRG